MQSSFISVNKRYPRLGIIQSVETITHRNQLKMTLIKSVY